MALRSFAGLTPVSMDESQCFLLSRVLIYMDRLLACYPKLDFEVLETVYWLVGPGIVEEDLVPLAMMLDTGERKRPFERGLPEEIHHARDFAHLMDTALRSASKGKQMCVVDLLRDLLKKRQDQLQSSGSVGYRKEPGQISADVWSQRSWKRDMYLFFLTLSVYEEAQSLFRVPSKM